MNIVFAMGNQKVAGNSVFTKFSIVYIMHVAIESKSFNYNHKTFFIIEAEFPDIVHSLDVWHKSKSIKKCLAKACYLQIHEAQYV